MKVLLPAPPATNPEGIKWLETARAEKGHSVVFGGAMGGSQSITFEEGVFFGASDPRTSSRYAKGF